MKRMPYHASLTVPYLHIERYLSGTLVTLSDGKSWSRTFLSDHFPRDRPRIYSLTFIEHRLARLLFR